MAEIIFLGTALKKRSEIPKSNVGKIFFSFFNKLNTWRWECCDQNLNLDLRSANPFGKIFYFFENDFNRDNIKCTPM
jgi:hypothetical protein